MTAPRLRGRGGAARALALSLTLGAAQAAFGQAIPEAAFAPQQRSARRSRPAQGQPARVAAARTPAAPEPLSAEDAALVKEMALLERVDLLKNLELFERGADERDPRAAEAESGAAREGAKRQP